MTARLRQSPNLTMCTKTTEVMMNTWVPNLESELCRPRQMSSSCPSACVAIWWICSAIKDLVTVSGQPVIFGRSAALCNSAVQPDDRGGQPWWWSATVNDDDDRDNDVMLGVMVKMMICQCQRVTNLRWKEKIRINLRPQYKASLYLSLTKKSSNQIIEWRLELMSQGFQLPLGWWKQLDDGNDDFLETKMS